jgi:hypothetical protein
LALLNSFLPEDPNAISTATDIDLGILFWKAPLTPEQVEKISGTTGVCHLHP